MMGKKDTQPSLFNYNVNLEKRVRKDNPLRIIKENIDFSFVREEVAHFYGCKGNVSVDPEVIMKMIFILFFDNLGSERELMRIIPERLDYLWFLGYGLDDKVPDHSVLSKARRLWGPEVFESLFVSTVMQCVEAGLLDGSKIHMDGSLVDANASKDSIKKGSPELIGALKSAYRREEQKLDDKNDDDDESGAVDSGESPDGKKTKSRKSYYEAKNDNLVSKTDPDAPVVRHRGMVPRPRYKNHRAVDDLHGVITASETTPGDVDESFELLGLVDQSGRNTGVQVDTVVADCQYGTVDNFRECIRRDLMCHMGDLNAKLNRSGSFARNKIFGEEHFIYDSQGDIYRCPAGNILKRRTLHASRQAYEYKISPKFCNACKLKPKCTRSKSGRSLKRHVDHDLVQAGRAQSASVAAKRDRRRRKHLMEGSFGDSANNHGFKRSRWRGLVNQRIQDWMIAACQNVRIYVSRVSLGPAKAARQRAVTGMGRFTANIRLIFSLDSA